MADNGTEPHDLLMARQEQFSRARRDAFVMAALSGIAGPLANLAASSPTGPSKVAYLAMVIADMTIATIDKVEPPRNSPIVEGFHGQPQ